MTEARQRTSSQQGRPPRADRLAAGRSERGQRKTCDRACPGYTAIRQRSDPLASRRQRQCASIRRPRLRVDELSCADSLPPVTMTRAP
jgi:hypothetical protein